MQISKHGSLKHPARQARVWVSVVLRPTLGTGKCQRKSRRAQRAGSLGDPRAAGSRPSLIILFLPDELFQKVADDYVSVAAFQVMTGVCFPLLQTFVCLWSLDCLTDSNAVVLSCYLSL